MFFILLLKGFIIGIAFIIPGVSGGTLAIYLGIYDQLLHSIGHVFKEFKKSVTFLIPVFLGIGISVILLAKLLGFLIDKNSFITLCFFIGLIIGGIPSISKQIDWKKKDTSGYIAMFFSVLLVIFLLVGKMMFKNSGVSSFEMNVLNIFLLIVLGFVASSTMIIPGISGSALLMVLGFYTAIVTNVVGEILDFSQITYHLYVIIPFLVGAVLGIIVFSKIIENLLKKFSIQTYKAIFGFIIASTLVIFFEIKDPSTASLWDNQAPIYLDLWNFLVSHLMSVLFGVICLGLGIYVSKLLVGFEGKMKKSER
jgi:putative membrane protein